MTTFLVFYIFSKGSKPDIVVIIKHNAFPYTPATSSNPLSSSHSLIKKMWGKKIAGILASCFLTFNNNVSLKKGSYEQFLSDSSFLYSSSRNSSKTWYNIKFKCTIIVVKALLKHHLTLEYNSMVEWLQECSLLPSTWHTNWCHSQHEGPADGGKI